MPVCRCCYLPVQYCIVSMIAEMLLGPKIIVPRKVLYAVENDVVPARALEQMTASEFRARYGPLMS